MRQKTGPRDTAAKTLKDIHRATRKQYSAGYHKTAEQGFAAAQSNLGDMFNKGWGVPQDDAEAAKWYRRAAVQGDADAQYSLC